MRALAWSLLPAIFLFEARAYSGCQVEGQITISDNVDYSGEPEGWEAEKYVFDGAEFYGFGHEEGTDWVYGPNVGTLEEYMYSPPFNVGSPNSTRGQVFGNFRLSIDWQPGSYTYCSHHETSFWGAWECVEETTEYDETYFEIDIVTGPENTVHYMHWFKNYNKLDKALVGIPPLVCDGSRITDYRVRMRNIRGGGTVEFRVHEASLTTLY